MALSLAPQRAEPDALEAYYFDAARTHEVLATVEREGPEFRLTVVETPFGVRDPRESVTRVESFGEPWEGRLALREFETRLAATGAPYWRSVGGAAPEPLPQVGRRQLDYKPAETSLPGDAARSVSYHHFFNRDGRTRVDLAVPRTDLPGERYALAKVEFRFPDVAGGDVRIVHPRLAPGLLRQQWVDAQIDLPKAGFQRLSSAVDYARAYGPEWRSEWEGAWRAAFERLAKGDLSEDAPPAAAPAPVEAPSDADAVLSRPVLVAVLARHLQRGETEALAGHGELAIRRFVAERRKKSHHDEQVELSLVESALLVMYGRSRGRLELAREEGSRLVRLVQAFEHAHRRVA